MVPQAKYFSLGGCGISAIHNASHGQINGSNEGDVWYTLGRDCTVPPSKVAKSCDQ